MSFPTSCRLSWHPRHVLLLLLAGATAIAPALPAQASASAPIVARLTTRRIRVQSCAAADSLLGPALTATRVKIQAGYVPSTDQTIALSEAPDAVALRDGVNYATSQVTFPGRVPPAALPFVRFTLRFVAPGTLEVPPDTVVLTADGVPVARRPPLGLAATAMAGTSRRFHTVALGLLPEEALALARAGEVVTSIAGLTMRLDADDQQALRSVLIFALCGPEKPL